MTTEWSPRAIHIRRVATHLASHDRRGAVADAEMCRVMKAASDQDESVRSNFRGKGIGIARLVPEPGSFIFWS